MGEGGDGGVEMEGGFVSCAEEVEHTAAAAPGWGGTGGWGLESGFEGCVGEVTQGGSKGHTQR